MLNYYMPTKIIWGKNVIVDNYKLFSEMGKKALIVTGRSSSKKNGSLDDVIMALKKGGIKYSIFDEVEENPSVSNVVKGANSGLDSDFIIGIGGGSPIDAAKAIAVIIKNNNIDPRELMFEKTVSSALPVIAIPTTAGTGTEVTPYAIITDHVNKTKKNYCQKVFPKYAIIDVKYFLTMPKKVRISTAVDALTHLVEGYLNINANLLNDYIAEEGFRLWGESKNYLNEDIIQENIMEKLIMSSTLAGMLISQTGTSLPHGMGYALTYFNNIPHGKANGVILKEYMKLCNKDKVNKIIELLGFNTLEEFGNYLKTIIGTVTITNSEANKYSETMFNNKGKLKNHPYDVTLEDIYNIYINSLNIGE